MQCSGKFTVEKSEKYKYQIRHWKNLYIGIFALPLYIHIIFEYNLKILYKMYNIVGI